MEEKLQLQDIHSAADPSVWPLAFGWWVLIVVVILLLIWLFLKLRRYLKRKQQQRDIYAQFAPLEDAFNENASNANIAEINIFLRQLTIQFYPPQETASLTGENWLQFLDQSGNTSQFTQGVGKILIEAPYQHAESSASKQDTDEQFLVVIKQWIKNTLKTRGKQYDV